MEAAESDAVVTDLLAHRGTALTGYGYLLCGDVHDAEDLVQDALVKVFSRRRAGLSFDSAEAYVRRAMLTTYVDGWRRRGRWRARVPVLATADHVEGGQEAAGTRLDVMAALSGLPRQQRACVVLRFYEDMTVTEIAQQLGVSDGAVKRYLSVGTRRLEALLGPVTDAEDSIELVREA